MLGGILKIHYSLEHYKIIISYIAVFLIHVQIPIIWPIEWAKKEGVGIQH